MIISRKAGWALGVALAALQTPASAADLPRYGAPPPAPPALEAAPSSPWTGFYLGGFAGGSLARDMQGYSVTSDWLTANLPALLPFVDAAGSQSLGLRGADLGVEAGYDWRAAPSFVVGVYGDLNWSGLSGSRTTSGTLPFVQLPYSINQQLGSDWRGSLRLKAGVTPLDNLLVYATGGPTLGRFTYSASFWDNLLPPFAPGAETEAVTLRQIRAGWTLGGGVEWAFSRNWSVGGEYRHSEYAAVTGTGVLPLQQPSSTAYINHSTGTIQVDSLRVGIGYHFN